MSRASNSYYTALGQTFQIASAASDAFFKEDIQLLAAAVNAHDHTTGYGKSIGHAGLFGMTANDHHNQAHIHNGVDGTANLAQAASHGSPDTDSATSSLHHTIGLTATTAAAGNHTHAGGAATGTGLYVLQTSPTITGPTISGAGITTSTLTSPVVNTQLTGTAVGSGASQVAVGNHTHGSGSYTGAGATTVINTTASGAQTDFAPGAYAKVWVYKNGLRMAPSGVDFTDNTPSAGSIRFAYGLVSGDRVMIDTV